MQGRSTSTLGFTLLEEILDESDIELKKIHTKEYPTYISIKVVPGVNSSIARSYSISFQLFEFDRARLDEL